MDLDKAFVYALLQEGKTGLTQVRMEGFHEGLLMGEGSVLFETVSKHLLTYGEMPSIPVIEAKTGVALDPVTEPLAFFSRELLARHVFTEVQATTDKVSKLLQGNDPLAALDHMLAEAAKIQLATVSAGGLESLPALSREGLQWYERVKSGERGIPLPWESLTKTTMGIWPEDLILFVARGGVGKTWLAILTAMVAWKAGKKVLFLTTEMAKYAIALRFTAVHLRLPYGRMRQGALDAFEEDRWRKALVELEQDDRWKIVGGDFDYQVDTLWAYVDSFEPDLLVVDGVYLLRTKDKGDKKHERAANVYDELKRGVKQRRGVGIVATTQFNREVKTGSKNPPDIRNIAQTDAAGWNCDAAYALSQSKEQRRRKRMTLIPMKVREGMLDEFDTVWDFETMDFSEVTKSTSPSLPGGVPAPSGGSSQDDDENLGSLF